MRPNENGGLLFGGFEKESNPIFHESCPTDFENTTLSLDLDHFCEYFFKNSRFYDLRFLFILNY